MLRIVDCLTVDHDLRLVLLAAAVCVFGWTATMIVSSRAAGPDRAVLWRCLLGLCAASTVWATHFIAVLAYQTSLPITYHAGLTAASLLVGLVVIGAGFAVAIVGSTTRTQRTLGGVAVGVGVILLHYVGMAALQFPGRLGYDADLVVLSMLCSAVFGALGLESTFAPVRRYRRVRGAAFLLLMTVSLHFTGMGATELEFGIADGEAGAGISRSALVIAVTLAALVSLSIGAAAAILDQRLSERLAAEAERFRTLADGAFEALLVHDHGTLVDANAPARALFGLSDDLARHDIDDLFGAGLDQTLRRWADQHAGTAAEMTLSRTDGSSFPAEISRRTIRLANGRAGELIAVRDLTQRKESEARITHLALHDPLTGLANRRFFIELASKARAQAERYDGHFALFAMDVDNFKLVNDMHGHAAGDELITTVATRITGALREGDVVARFGGDEFAVLETSTVQPHDAMALAERLVELFQQPIRLTDAEVVVSASIGIALYPVDGVTLDELMRNADTAMYRAKADGKATYRFFEPQMDAVLATRRKLETRLRRAIVEERLAVAYQPLVDCTTHVPLGFEALVRWTDDELGSVSPAEFIPVAEETGLVVALGEFVLQRACRDAVTWPLPLRVAVNLSAVQFKRKGLVETVERALADSGLPGERLELEITESLLIDNRDEALRILSDLKKLGVNIAMDDFGTGYSSLSYLQSFSFDKIKIDRSFVADLECNEQNAGIVRAVMSMGKSLHMRVVAEGVESGAQAGILRGLQCDELQGFYFAKPMPGDAVAAFIAERSATRRASLQRVG